MGLAVVELRLTGIQDMAYTATNSTTTAACVAAVIYGDSLQS